MASWRWAPLCICITRCEQEHWRHRARAEARAESDRATDLSAGGEHSQLDGGPDDPNGVLTNGGLGPTPARYGRAAARTQPEAPRRGSRRAAGP
jgi:hypothetical protein